MQCDCFCCVLKSLLGEAYLLQLEEETRNSDEQTELKREEIYIKHKEGFRNFLKNK